MSCVVRQMQAALLAQCYQGLHRPPTESIDTAEYVSDGPDQNAQADVGLRCSHKVKEPLPHVEHHINAFLYERALVRIQAK